MKALYLIITIKQVLPLFQVFLSYLILRNHLVCLIGELIWKDPF